MTTDPTVPPQLPEPPVARLTEEEREAAREAAREAVCRIMANFNRALAAWRRSMQPAVERTTQIMEALNATTQAAQSPQINKGSNDQQRPAWQSPHGPARTRRNHP